MYQPSANQIANLYQGNPNALAQKVATEPKGPTGLPRDLSKLMALNIDLTETDAAKRQAALAGLQQMQQGQPEPPTIAQSIQQQAEEKAKAMAVQAQRQQQGLQALAQQHGMFGATPEHTPQPERQPSGIDELRTNLGENYAGGGIIAFSKPTDENNRSLVKDPDEDKYETPYDRRNRLLNESGERFGQPSKQSISEAEIPKAENVEFNAEGLPRSKTEQAEIIARNNAVANVQANAQKLGQMRDQRLQQMQNPQLSADYLERMKEFYKPRREPSGIENLIVQQGATPQQNAPAPAPSSEKTQPSAQNAAATGNKPSIVNLPSASNSVVQSTGTQRTSPNVATPTAPADPLTEQLNSFFKAAIEKTPAQQRDEAVARMVAAYGAPDTSAQEKYIQQLEDRRAAFAEPTDPYERFRRYARTAANAGGRTSLQTGAATSQALEQQRLSNEQKNMEVLKELMGESGKLADVKRGYKKELFGFGEKTYDDAFKTGLDVAKELKLDSRQAQLFAHQSAENALNRANAIAVAGMPGADQKEFNLYAKDWMSKPENAGKTLSDAYGAFKLAGQGYRPEQARVGMIEKYAKDWSTMEMMDKMKYNKEGINNAEDYVKYMMRITEQNKPGASSAGAAITKAQYDALPKGASYTAPDGSQRIKG